MPLLPARSVVGTDSRVLRTSNTSVSGVGWHKATAIRLVCEAATPCLKAFSTKGSSSMGASGTSSRGAGGAKATITRSVKRSCMSVM